LLFNGHTVHTMNEISEEHFLGMLFLFGSGLLGAKATYDAVGPLTNAVWNYFRRPADKAFVEKDYYPQVYEFFHKKLADEQINIGMSKFVAWASQKAKVENFEH
jgi:hypothetical protein